MKHNFIYQNLVTVRNKNSQKRLVKLSFCYRSPLCSLVNQHMYNLAHKFPETKFLKSISSLCIPNYPDKNLPTIFVYFEGELKKQFVGPVALGGMNLKQEGE